MTEVLIKYSTNCIYCAPFLEDDDYDADDEETSRKGTGELKNLVY